MPRSLCDGLVGSARQPGALVMCHQDMTCCITSATLARPMQWKAGASGAGQGFAPRRPRNESTQPRAWPGIASIFLTILIGGQDRKALKTPELARGFPPLGRSCPPVPFPLTRRGTRSPTSRTKLSYLKSAERTKTGDRLCERAAARFDVGDGDDRSCNLHRSASFLPAHGFIGWFEVATVAR